MDLCPEEQSNQRNQRATGNSSQEQEVIAAGVPKRQEFLFHEESAMDV
jgi:hypothetical protein